ncbi:MAG: DUF72 domain-containing protein [Thermoproteus sp.]
MIVGTCGFPKSRKEIYKSLDAVELQETFYNFPREERMKALAEEAPPGFVFAVKVFQGLTHPAGSPTYRRTRGFSPGPGHGLLRPTRENLELWDAFRRAVEPLRPRVYIFQTPPSMGVELLREAVEFFRTIRGEGIFVWEPRGAIASIPNLDEILSEVGVSLVVDPLRKAVPRSPIYYFRLHGLGRGEVNYSYRYTDEDLARLLEIVKKLENPYVMFNNVYMFEDAVRFKKLLKVSF